MAELHGGACLDELLQDEEGLIGLEHVGLESLQHVLQVQDFVLEVQVLVKLETLFHRIKGV